MAITALNRNFNGYPNIVYMYTTDTLSVMTTTGYWTSQLTTVEALNNGVWQWEINSSGGYTDLIYCFYAGGQGFLLFNPTNQCFGALSSSLPPGSITGTEIATNTISGGFTGNIALHTIDGTNISPNSISFGELGLLVSQSTTIPVTASQIQNMYATPILLIGSYGPTYFIVVDSIFLDIAYGGTQYAGGGPIAVQYGNTPNGAGPTASAIIPAATLNGVNANTYLSATTTTLDVAATNINTSIYLSNTTGAFTSGNSNMTLYVRYHVLNPV